MKKQGSRFVVVFLVMALVGSIGTTAWSRMGQGGAVFVAGDLENPECKTDGSFSTTIPSYCENWYDDATELGDLGSIGDRLEQDYGDRWVGCWIDRSVTPSALRVGVVDPTAQDAATLSNVSGLPASRATLVPAKYSLAQLESYRASAGAILESKSYASMFGISVHIDKIEIATAGPDPLLPSRLAAAGLPSDSYQIWSDLSGSFTLLSHSG